MESNCEGHKKDTVGVSCCELLAWVEKEDLQKISTPSEHCPNLRFRTEAEYARRAVCLGAGEADRAPTLCEPRWEEIASTAPSVRCHF